MTGRSHSLSTLAMLVICAGCAYPPARIEFERDAESGDPAVVFDFAQAETLAGTRYGHRAHFLFGEGVSRVAFRLRQEIPETWSLRWADRTEGKHEVLVLVGQKRGRTPRLELLSPRQGIAEWGEDPATDFPELGDRIGLFEGETLRFQLAADGSVTQAEPLEESPSND